MIQKRDVLSVILLSIFTFGIYNLYWFIVVTNEIEASLMQKDGSVPSGGMAFLFSLLTCGIYMIYWYYKQGQRIAQLQRENNMQGNDNSVLYLVLAIVGMSIVNTALIQSDINGIVQTNMNGGNSGGGYNI